MVLLYETTEYDFQTGLRDEINQKNFQQIYCSYNQI